MKKAILLAVLLFPLYLPGQSRPIVFKGATLIDGTGRPAIPNSLIVVSGGRIQSIGGAGSVSVPKDAEVQDVSGKTIMPALVSLHVHLAQTLDGLNPNPLSYTEANVRAQLENFLKYGVGTILSLGTDQDFIYKLRDLQASGRVSGAHIYTAGRGFGVEGGFPPGALGVHRPKTPEEARAQVRELATHHPDFVKVWVDDGFGAFPKIQPEIYRAIISEAHQNHLRVIAHVFYLADAKLLLAAGVDGLGHSIRDLPVDEDLIKALRERRVIYIPTLVRDESTFAYAEGPSWLHDPFFRAGLEASVLSQLQSDAFRQKFRNDPNLAKYQAALEMGKKNLKTLWNAGVRIGFGTDAGPANRFQGYFEHRELQLIVESGLTPLQAIVCAARNSATFLDPRSSFGTLEPGKRADFLVLNANPLDDIHNTENLGEVWQAGIRHAAIVPR